MRTHIKKDKIEKALQLLNEAAHDEKDAVSELLENKYEDLKGFFGDIVTNGKEVKETTEKWFKKIKINKKWAFWGGMALGSVALLKLKKAYEVGK